MKASIALTIFSAFFCLAKSISVNVTIDDTIPDPFSGVTISYSPAAAWNDGPTCKTCSAHPDPNQMMSRTWHDTTFNPQSGDFVNTPLFATTTFYGSAVYVICALAQSTDFPAGNSEMTFFIDNVRVGSFELPAPGGTGYTYRVPVYSNTSLELGQHQITIQNGHVNGPKSLILLDAIIYSFDEKELATARPQTLPSPQPSAQQFAPLSQSASARSTTQNPTSTFSSKSLRPSSSSLRRVSTSSEQGTSLLRSASFPQQSGESHPLHPSSQLSVKPVSRVGLIVGLILGGFCLLGVIVALVYYRRRRKRQFAPVDDMADPWVAGTHLHLIPPRMTPARFDNPLTEEGKHTGRRAITPLSTHWQGHDGLPTTALAGPSTRPSTVEEHHRHLSFGSLVSATPSNGSRPLNSFSRNELFYTPEGMSRSC